MLITLLNHEILNLLKSNRIFLSVLIFLILFVSVFSIRVLAFQEQLNQYIDDMRTYNERLQNVTTYSQINLNAIQKPILFSIYNQGFRFPRVVSIRYYEPILRTISINEANNKIYTQKSNLDITFLITFFLSLFILLVSYDSVNGEKTTGTLKLLMTFPIKRQSFILKKILGIFILISVSFTIPYIISLITLILIYADLLTMTFYLSFFFYYLLTLLYIFFFCLLGIFISCSTNNPNHSLVFSLLIWVLLTIILPVSYDKIVSPVINNETIEKLTRIYDEKLKLSRRIFSLQEVDETKYNTNDLDMGAEYLEWSGGFFYDAKVWAFTETYEKRINFQNYVINEYYPISKEVEQAIDGIYRKRINMEDVKVWVLFFNPITLFENLSQKITGNSRFDHLIFLHDSRYIRDELVQLGRNEGWLQDKRFFTMYKEEFEPGSIKKIYDSFNGDTNKAWEHIMTFYEWELEPFNMVLPSIRNYTQPPLLFGEIFLRMWRYLLLFVINILILLILTWLKFMRYDLR